MPFRALAVGVYPTLAFISRLGYVPGYLWFLNLIESNSPASPRPNMVTITRKVSDRR